MTNENLMKAALIFGGGFLLFMLAKPKNIAALSMPSSSDGTKTSFDSTKPPDKANADIVANAYGEALNAGETPARLSELNKELTKEFNMRCYMDKNNQLVVTDVKGNVILTK